MKICLKNNIVPDKLWPIRKDLKDEELDYDFYLYIYVKHLNEYRQCYAKHHLPQPLIELDNSSSFLIR